MRDRASQSQPVGVLTKHPAVNRLHFLSILGCFLQINGGNIPCRIPLSLRSCERGSPQMTVKSKPLPVPLHTKTKVDSVADGRHHQSRIRPGQLAADHPSDSRSSDGDSDDDARHLGHVPSSTLFGRVAKSLRGTTWVA